MNDSQVQQLKSFMRLLLYGAWKNVTRLRDLLGDEGNMKIPRTTAIFNMSSATDCPSRKLGLCKAVVDGKHICYAIRSENSSRPWIKSSNQYHREISDNVIELYGKGLDVSEIMERYQLSERTFYRIVSNYSGPKINRAHRKYAVDISYFDNIDTPNKAYFLGLLYADGCNYGDGVYLLLATPDHHVLYDLGREVIPHGDLPIYERKPKKRNHKLSYKLNIGSQEIAEKLARHGVVKAKTYKMALSSTIPDSLFSHFLRGFFDGDGSVWTDSRKGRLHVTFTSMPFFLEQLRKKIEFFLGIEIRNKLSQSEGNKAADLILSKKSVLRALWTYMYTDAEIFFHRKRDKFETYFC